MRARKSRFEFQRLSILGDALVQLARIIENRSHILINDEREWVDLLRVCFFRERISVSSNCCKVTGVPVMTESVSLIKLESVFEFLFSSGPIPVIKSDDVSDRSLRLNERVVDLQRLCCRRFGSRHGFCR